MASISIALLILLYCIHVLHCSSIFSIIKLLKNPNIVPSAECRFSHHTNTQIVLTKRDESALLSKVQNGKITIPPGRDSNPGGKVAIRLKIPRGKNF